MSTVPKDAAVVTDQSEGSYVYFLMNGDECIYVGQTANLRKRISEHRLTRNFTHSVFLHVAPDARIEVERHWIKALKPKENRSGGNYTDSRMVSMRIPDALWKRLGVIAKQQNMSRNNLIVESIEQFLSYQE